MAYESRIQFSALNMIVRINLMKCISSLVLDFNNMVYNCSEADKWGDDFYISTHSYLSKIILLLTMFQAC